jgi:hypothetical protein
MDNKEHVNELLNGAKKITLLLEDFAEADRASILGLANTIEANRCLRSPAASFGLEVPVSPVVDK